MKAPKARKIKTILQDQRIDPYYWMRKKEDVLPYIQKEQEYFKHHIHPAKKIQNQIYEELKRKIPGKDASPPYPFKDYMYWSRFEENKEYPIYCRKKKNSDEEEIILDVNQLAEGRPYCSLNNISLSFSHQRAAFSVDTVGRRFHTIFFKDLKTNEVLQQNIPSTTGEMLWANDDQHLFYVKQDQKTLRSHKVFRYNLKNQKHELVFEEKDETFSVDIYKSLSEKYIFIQSLSSMTAETRFAPADSPGSPFEVFLKRKRGHKYFVEDGEDCFYILTNADNCRNYRLDKAPLTKRHDWKTILPHSKDVYIEDFHVFSDFIALEARENSLTQVFVMDRKTNQIKKWPPPSSPHVAELDVNANFKTDLLRLSYESMLTPETIYDYNVLTGRSQWIHQKKPAVPFHSEKYRQERIEIPARDGVKIPVSLLYKKDFKKYSNPLYLYGYGSYGYSMEPFFSQNIFSLVDRGFVFAIAHVRGGAEKGKWWHEQGRLLNKKNTFTDFIDCSEFLVQQGYGKRLYAVGGSAGGLLIGNILNNSRPGLYTGLTAHVPFVDVVTTMQDASIPLTTQEYDEWGSPEDQKYYDYMKSYSPYDNVKPGPFPHLLITSGFHDSQVQYWEPVKWTARLRDCQKNNSLILLYMDMDSGHSGSTGRFKRLKLLALEYAFFLTLEKSLMEPAAPKKSEVKNK